MPAVAGKGGSFKVGANSVANLKNFKLDINQDLKETTNFASNGWKEQTPTVKSWSGSVDGDWNMADTTGQKALQDALLGGTSVSAVFGTNGTNTYTGSAFIKKISIQEQVDDIVKFTADLEGTAVLTYA
jgi:predicted secreted protein